MDAQSKHTQSFYIESSRAMVGLIFEHHSQYMSRYLRYFAILLSRQFCLLFVIACSKEEDEYDGDLIEVIDQSIENKEESSACMGEIKNTRQRQLSRGIIEGIESNGVISFLGIPYAKAPIGELRWQAPEEEQACFTGVFHATQDAHACPQLDDHGQIIGNEDCLSLNIWAPLHKKAKPLPVMVFIHGGGNQKGSAIVKHEGKRLYDGSKLVLEESVILVVIQYRLGVLGWLNLDNELSGNYGLMDQIAALKWIKNEISAFGGDSNQITIFGESAGARNVCALMVSPYARDLFQAAIMQSGSCYLPSETMVTEASKAFLTQSPCRHAQKEASLKCLSQLSLDQIFRAKKPIVNIRGMSDQLQPYVDGKWIRQDPFDSISEGKINVKALIVGSNQNETSIQLPELDDDTMLQKAVYAQYGHLTDEILALYESQVLSPKQKLEQITSDAKYVCHARRIARAMSHGPTKVYLYSFGQILSQSLKYREYESYHGIELPFIFFKFNKQMASSAEIKTSQAITQYWGELAKYQAIRQIKTRDLPVWPSYSSLEEQLIFDRDGIRLVQQYQKKECDFWDQHYDLF